MVEQVANHFKRSKASRALSTKKAAEAALSKKEAVYAASFCFLARALGWGFSAFSCFSTAS